MGEEIFEKYSSLPKIIIESKNPYVKLLSDEMISKYYYRDLRVEIDKYFKKFNDLSYLCHFSVSSNSLNEKVNTSNVSDSVGKFVENNMDNIEWASKFYNRIVSLSKKLTKEEGIYLVYTFFINASEEKISEELDMSRFTLQKIKKSCLIKTYNNLNDFF